MAFLKMKKKVLFIYNPISGANKKKAIPDLVKANLDLDKYSYEIWPTEAPGHAALLSNKGRTDGFEIVTAIGGDGTINEIGNDLAGTNTVLGIIPNGSGNGLARHLGLSLNIKKAIGHINEGKTGKIDVGSVNGKLFFCTSGVGFDAFIGKKFAESTKRGFKTYLKTTLAEFVNYQPEEYSIKVNGVVMKKKAFLVSFANAGQYGNNAYISPLADIQDGFLDVCIISPFPKIKLIGMGVDLFRKKIHKSPYVQILKAKEILLQRVDKGEIHLDGEPFEMGRELSVKILPSALNVIVP